MLLQALVRYYEILSEDEDCDIPKQGFSKVKVSYSLVITKAGELIAVDPLKILDAKGKKYLPTEMEVPEQVNKSSGIAERFLCGNSSYVLGFDNKGKPERTKKCFLAFRDLHRMLLGSTSCEEANALVLFLEKWNVETAPENHLFTEYLKDFYKGANFVFRLDGKTLFIHENTIIKSIWTQYKSRLSDENTLGNCLVTGNKMPISRVHPSIKGINGGQPMGNSLISFNSSAYESYGNKDSQGLNAPVSEYVAFAYTTVLNRLLSDALHTIVLGDSTIVFWAESPQTKVYQDMFVEVLNPDDIDFSETDNIKYVRDEATINTLKGLFGKVKNGKKNSVDFQIDEKVRFYILALSPNAGRAAIRLFLSSSFVTFINRIKEHYENLAIEHDKKEKDSISISQMLLETVLPSSKEKFSSPLLSGAVFRSILSGAPYPEELFNAIMIRIHAKKEINYVKAAIIKAYLIKSTSKPDYNYFKEVLTMSLNTESKYMPYILGRLFAALERAQQNANPGINSTIKDRYFTSACANPRLTFPTLLKLANYHTGKTTYGYKDEKLIEEILILIEIKDENPYPARLTLDEQGVFILGYYHQKNKIFDNIRVQGEAIEQKSTQQEEL